MDYRFLPRNNDALTPSLSCVIGVLLEGERNVFASAIQDFSLRGSYVRVLASVLSLEDPLQSCRQLKLGVGQVPLESF